MNSNNIQSFNENILPWERGVRKGGMMNKEVMRRNLLDFKEVLDKYNVVFVFIFGGLLGLIRQGDFIPYDTDLDVACFDESKRRDHWKLAKIKEELKQKGFYVVSNDVCYLHNDFFIREGEKIEIWWFDKIDDEWIFGNTVRYPAHYFDKLDEIDFLKTKFKVPSNAEEFLKLTYGKNWKKPKKDAIYLNLNVRKRKKNEH